MDYVEVEATPDAVFDALHRFKTDPDHYAAVRARCAARAADFNPTALAHKWAALVEKIDPTTPAS